MQNKKPQNSRNGGRERIRRDTNDTAISVLILQNGAKQAERNFKRKFLFKSDVSFGRKKRCSIHIPYSALPDEINLLRVSSKSVTLLLDPRYQGTINDGHRIGSVSEFLSPRGSLLHMGSVLEPLKVPLGLGARVSLKLGDFEILVKISAGKTQDVQSSRFQDNARGGMLKLPDWNDPFENWVPIIGGFFAALVFVPLVFFLLKSDNFREIGMRHLPFDYMREFVHPKHYAVLPYVFRENMDGKDLNALTFQWVGELQNRWRVASKISESSLPSLGSFPIGSSQMPALEELEKKARLAFEDRYKIRLNSSITSPLDQDRFLSVLKEYSNLLTEVSGGLEGSFYIQMINRIALVHKMHEAIKSIEETEQETLTEMFLKEGIKYQPFQGPTMETLVGARPSAEFALDFERRKKVAEYARDAESTSLRAKFLGWSLKEVKKQGYGTVWIDDDGVLVPSLLKSRLDLPEESMNHFWSNAEYSARIKLIPAVPLPEPTINLMDVDLLMFGKREELRACYENSLRRNGNVFGEVKWEMKVSMRGKIEALRIAKTQIKDKEFLLCLKDRIQSWNFPKAKNGTVTFEYPLRFKKSSINEKP